MDQIVLKHKTLIRSVNDILELFKNYIDYNIHKCPKEDFYNTDTLKLLKRQTSRLKNNQSDIENDIKTLIHELSEFKVDDRKQANLVRHILTKKQRKNVMVSPEIIEIASNVLGNITHKINHPKDESVGLLQATETLEESINKINNNDTDIIILTPEPSSSSASSSSNSSFNGDQFLDLEQIVNTNYKSKKTSLSNIEPSKTLILKKCFVKITKMDQKKADKKLNSQRCMTCHKISKDNSVELSCSLRKKRFECRKCLKVSALNELSSVFDGILNDIMDLDISKPFLYEVKESQAQDYHKIIKNPIDLSIIREQIKNNHYTNRSCFYADLKLMHSNSMLYNGPENKITKKAKQILEIVQENFSEFPPKKLFNLENEIDHLVQYTALNNILFQIFNEIIMRCEHVNEFYEPVNIHVYKDYLDNVKNPIDLKTIKKKTLSKKYQTTNEFIADFELMHDNSASFNGIYNDFTRVAENVLNTCNNACEFEFKTLLNMRL
jgi:hypothetical protein